MLAARATRVGSDQQTNDVRSLQELFEGVRNIRDLAEAHASIATGKCTWLAASCCR